MSNYAKNIRTLTAELPSNGDILELPADKHRTYLMVENLSDTDLRFWIGPLVPPADITQWPTVAYLPLHFPEGVHGPILLAEPGAVLTELVIVSSQIEDPRVYAPIDNYATRIELTDDFGSLLCTDPGNDLLYHLI